MGLLAGILGCRLGLVSGLDRRIVAGINAGFGAGLGGVTHLGALVLHVLHGGTGIDVGRSRGGSIEFGANLCLGRRFGFVRSEEHTSELQSLMRLSYAVFCL